MVDDAKQNESYDCDGAPMAVTPFDDLID
jgi:hypothetical protein